MGALLVIPAGLVLGGIATFSHHLGWAGTGGRPFVAFLMLGVAAVFLLEEWTG